MLKDWGMCGWLYKKIPTGPDQTRIALTSCNYDVFLFDCNYLFCLLYELKVAVYSYINILYTQARLSCGLLVITMKDKKHHS